MNVTNRGDEHTRYGEWDFGTEADFPVLDHELRFLDLYLKDIDDGISQEPRVKVFLMGENLWLELDDWPPPGAEIQEWYLASEGDARGLKSNGRLSREKPKDTPYDTFTYDPHDPVPTHGGVIYWGPVLCQHHIDGSAVSLWCRCKAR